MKKSQPVEELWKASETVRNAKYKSGKVLRWILALWIAELQALLGMSKRTVG